MITFEQMCEKLANIKKISNLKELEVISVGKDTATRAKKCLNVNVTTEGWIGRHIEYWYLVPC